jgi:hypothetical protein
MNLINRTVHSILILFLFASNAGASYKELTAIKAQGKGFAITADHNGTESLFKNPAGLDSIDRPEISSSYGSFFANFLQVSNLSLGLPISEKLTFGVSIPINLVSNIPQTIESSGAGVQTGTFDDIDSSIIMGASYELIEKTLSIGASTTYTYHLIGTTKGTSIGFDAGILWDTELGTFGLSAQNIGSTTMTWDTGTKEIQETKYNLGFCTEFPLLDKVSIDATSEKDKDITYNLGMEKRLGEALALLAGIQHLEKEKTITLGASLTVDNFTLNYAFQNNERLGNCYTVGLKLKF